MLTPIPSVQDAEALRAFREILARMDPEAKVFMDDHSGELLVKGRFDAPQLSEAIERSGISVRVVAAGGGACCGGCGCS